MTEKIMIADLPEFDASLYLDNDEAIADYLTAIIEDSDSALLAAALGDIARGGLNDRVYASKRKISPVIEITSGAHSILREESCRFLVGLKLTDYSESLVLTSFTVNRLCQQCELPYSCLFISQ